MMYTTRPFRVGRARASVVARSAFRRERGRAQPREGCETRQFRNAVQERGSMNENKRWLQLVVGMICMVMIANLQYGWTYFVDPMNAKYHWSRTDIQIAFTIFIATETWLVPV